MTFPGGKGRYNLPRAMVRINKSTKCHLLQIQVLQFLRSRTWRLKRLRGNYLHSPKLTAFLGPKMMGLGKGPTPLKKLQFLVSMLDFLGVLIFVFVFQTEMPGGYVQYFWTFEFILLVRGYTVILSFSEEQCLRRYETPPQKEHVGTYTLIV